MENEKHIYFMIVEILLHKLQNEKNIFEKNTKIFVIINKKITINLTYEFDWKFSDCEQMIDWTVEIACL